MLGEPRGRRAAYDPNPLHDAGDFRNARCTPFAALPCRAS
jgi:hypothetical protein